MAQNDFGYPYGEFDASKWTEEFFRIYPWDRERPDFETMLGWFANAIMTGYDKAIRDNEAKIIHSDYIHDLNVALDEYNRKETHQ